MQGCGGRRFGRLEAKVNVAGQFGGALAGAFRQVALTDGLEAPREASDEPGLVPGGGGFTEQLGVAGLQLADAQPLQGGELVAVIHGVVLSESRKRNPEGH